MAGLHAKRGPSGSPYWTLCLAKLNREESIPDTSSKVAANRGTICHDISAKALVDGHDDRIRVVSNGYHGIVREDTGNVDYIHSANASSAPEALEVDDDIIRSARVYTDFVRKLAMVGELHVEQRVPIDHITGEGRWVNPDGTECTQVTKRKDARWIGATGTADCGVIAPPEIIVADLKSGREPVFAKYPIDAAIAAVTGRPVGSLMPNTQHIMYASGFIRKHCEGRKIERVRIIVVQPPLDHIDEYEMPIEEFNFWVEWISKRAMASMDPAAPATPGESQCKYCRAAPTCPEYRDLVFQEACNTFETLDGMTAHKPREVPQDDLARTYGYLDMIETWCAKQRGRMFDALASGDLGKGCGWKLVRGRQGNREWKDDAAVKASLLEEGLTPAQIHTKPQIVGPAVIESIVGPSSEKWERIKVHLAERREGKLTVAPEFDERPGVLPTTEAAAAFSDLTSVAPLPASVAKFFTDTGDKALAGNLFPEVPTTEVTPWQKFF